MKTQFKRFIPFLLAALIAWPAWALTIQGGNGSAIQGGNATIQGSQWTPLKISNLVAWYDASSQANFTFNGPGADLVDEDFTTNPGWTNFGNGIKTVTGGEHVTQSDGGADGAFQSFTAQTEAWAQFTIILDDGFTGFDSGKVILGSGLGKISSNGERLLLGLINDSGTIKFRSRYKTDSSVVQTSHDSPVFTAGKIYTITLHFKAGAGTGIAEVWIDKTKVLDVQDVVNGTLDTDIFGVGSMTSASTIGYTIRNDYVNVGTTGASPAQISQWNDLSVNANHLLQATAVNQPDYDSSGPQVTFDGATEFLQVASLAGGDKSQPNSMIIVARNNGTSTGNSYFIDGTSGKRNAFIYKQGNSAVSLFAGTADRTGSNIDTNFHIFAPIFDDPANKSTLYIDGGAKDIDLTSSGSDVLGGITLASRFNGVDHFDVTFKEVIFYNKTLSTSEINQLGNYVADKHGLTWTDLP